MPVTHNPTLPEKKDYPVLPAGIYSVEIQAIESGLQRPFGAKEGEPETEPFYRFTFLVLGDAVSGDKSEYRGRKLWSKRAKAVLPIPPEGKMKPSLVYRVARAVLRRDITYDEASKWTIKEINDLEGCQLQLMVTITPPKDGKTYNEIVEFMKVDRILPKIQDGEHAETESEEHVIQ
jgi:hypothetical protein